MKQAELMQKCMALKPGWATKITYDDLSEAASANFGALDGFRYSDVVDFAKTMAKNWGVVVTEDVPPVVPYFWTIFKPRERKTK